MRIENCDLARVQLIIITTKYRRSKAAIVFSVSTSTFTGHLNSTNTETACHFPVRFFPSPALSSAIKDKKWASCLAESTSAPYAHATYKLYVWIEMRGYETVACGLDDLASK